MESHRSGRSLGGWRLVAGAAVVFALLRIVGSYSTFSHTFDEPVHLAAGLEWWSGNYTYDGQHPPLARATMAFIPKLRGAHSTGEASVWREASEVLKTGAGYEGNLTGARLGILPFFVLACVVIWWWGRRIGGEVGGAMAVVLFSLTPAVVAHAGMATTDMPLVATLLLVCATWLRWSERPRSLGRGAMLGLAGGIALATKFSAIPYFGLAALVSLFFVRPWRAATPRELARTLGLAALIAFAVLWAAYQVSVGLAGGLLVPFPQFFGGLGQLAQHNAEGHFNYLLGKASTHGRFLFFPIVLAVKTPIALLVLGGLAAVWAVRRWWRSGRRERGAFLPLLIGVGIFAIAMGANINAGARHILPVYALGAVATGAFLARVWDHGGALRTFAAALVGVLMIESSAAHPDTLAYFNVFAGEEPGRILVDSDLDWGQDLHRLADTVRARRITHLALAYYGSTSHARDVLPPLRPVAKHAPDTGWVAISETYYRAGAIDNEPRLWQIDSTGYRWLHDREPVARVGKSIRLYHIPRGSLPP